MSGFLVLFFFFFLNSLTILQFAVPVPSFEFQRHVTTEPCLDQLLVSALTLCCGCKPFGKAQKEEPVVWQIPQILAITQVGLVSSIVWAWFLVHFLLRRLLLLLLCRHWHRKGLHFYQLMQCPLLKKLWVGGLCKKKKGVRPKQLFNFPKEVFQDCSVFHN